MQAFGTTQLKLLTDLKEGQRGDRLKALKT